MTATTLTGTQPVPSVTDAAPTPGRVAAADIASYDVGSCEHPLLNETVGDNFDRIAATHGGRDALVEHATGRRWSYSRLRADVNALALGLIRLGIEKGDRVGIWSPNCAENGPSCSTPPPRSARSWCASIRRNRSHELAYVLTQSGIRLLIAAPSFRNADCAQMISEVRPGCPQLEHVVLLDNDWLALPDRETDPLVLATRQAGLDPREPINIHYTSGTTGSPKGATLSHHNILNNAHFVGEACRYTPADRICVPVPLFHTFGMVIGNLGATTHGACLVYPGPSFDPVATLATVQQERCTSLYGVPAMFIAELAVLDAAERDA